MSPSKPKTKPVAASALTPHAADAARRDDAHPTGNGLRHWAISTLLMYEACPMRVKLSKIERLPEPPRDPATDPLERGNREHGRLEQFVKGDIRALDHCEAKQIEKFKPALEHAQQLYAAGIATAEQDWFFDENWQPCEKQNRWLWVKLDINVLDEENRTAIPGDYKTGKSAYKVVDHIQQMNLYSIAAVLKFDWVDFVLPELWYLDEGWIRSSAQPMNRDQALARIASFQARADRMMSDKHFRPNPNKVTCKWCPYSPRGTGACPVGV